MSRDNWFQMHEDERRIRIETDDLEAAIPKKDPKQWMTGIEKGSFLDKATGFREVGDGLMVVDWLMEPGAVVNMQMRHLRPMEMASHVTLGTKTKLSHPRRIMRSNATAGAIASAS